MTVRASNYPLQQRAWWKTLHAECQTTACTEKDLCLRLFQHLEWDSYCLQCSNLSWLIQDNLQLDVQNHPSRMTQNTEFKELGWPYESLVKLDLAAKSLFSHVACPSHRMPPWLLHANITHCSPNGSQGTCPSSFRSLRSTANFKTQNSINIYIFFPLLLRPKK